MMRTRTVAGVTGVGILLWALVVRGSLALDLGVGRRYRPLGPLRFAIAAPREVVFDVVSSPYLGRTPRALRAKLDVLERGDDLVLAAHYTHVYGLEATTVETVRFEPPERVHFRLVRGPVPHVVEHSSFMRRRTEPSSSTRASWVPISGRSVASGAAPSRRPGRRRSRRRSTPSGMKPSAGLSVRRRTLAGVSSEPPVDAPPYSTRGVRALRIPGHGVEDDLVAVEEPLEIRIGDQPVAVTMRTPGHDEELALGFCLTEGLAPVSARIPDDLAANTVEVEAGGFDPERMRRHFYTSSSCGVCGKGAIEAVQVEAPRIEGSLWVRADVLASLPDVLRSAQRAFAATGGLHATGLFTAEGELLCAREDVGRHNALDKVVGWAFLEGLLPLASHVLCVSGRLSFELVQKASVAGCPVVVAVGAPSSLAVELAHDRGLTLCGFVREGRMTVYSEPWRVI